MLNPQLIPVELQKWGGQYDESKVNRDEGGQFAPKGAGGGSAKVNSADRKALNSYVNGEIDKNRLHAALAVSHGNRPKSGPGSSRDIIRQADDARALREAGKGWKNPKDAKEVVERVKRYQGRQRAEENKGNRVRRDGTIAEKRGRLSGAGRYGLRGAAYGAASGAAAGAAYGASRGGRAGAAIGALGGASVGARLGATGGAVGGAVSPGYRDTDRSIFKANAFDDFGVAKLTKRK